MSDKPVLLVTRKLPDAVEARAMRDYDAILNTSDEQLSAADLIERSKGVDAILTCSTELFPPKSSKVWHHPSKRSRPSPSATSTSTPLPPRSEALSQPTRQMS